MMPITRRLAMAAAACMLVASAPAAQQTFDRGRALYENHCEHCHEGWAHTRDRRSVTSLEGLRGRVASWSVHAGLDWSAEDIREVTSYLNRRFYHLTE